MSQIMRFHKHPNNYNWSIMPNSISYSNRNSAGANQISKLMLDASSSVNMDFGCSGSSAETEDSASALRNRFGYSSANYTSASYDVIESEMSKSKPVILRGGRRQDWVIFSVYTGGHAWICDGIKKYKMKIRISPGASPIHPGGIANIHLATVWSFHMNWGWGGYLDGWYSNWENKEGRFTYKTGMVYNIRK